MILNAIGLKYKSLFFGNHVLFTAAPSGCILMCQCSKTHTMQLCPHFECIGALLYSKVSTMSVLKTTT